MDRLLDETRSGPTFLRQPAVAELVRASILYGADVGHYEIHSWVIMANHVHLLITPRIGLSQLFCSLKTATATRANRLLHRTGQPFWQDESYDHLVRGEDEFRRIQRYIENNPVKACLAASPENYIWSSAWRPERAPQAVSLPHWDPEAPPQAVSLLHNP
jgi:REP element-mobilizing transposase RayT